MASLMSIIRNSRFGKAFSAARHAPKGQKMRALNLSLSGGVPAENYAEVKKNLDYRTNSLESMYGPAPNVASLDVSTAYGDMLRLSDLLEETSQIQGTRAEDEVFKTGLLFDISTYLEAFGKTQVADVAVFYQGIEMDTAWGADSSRARVAVVEQLLHASQAKAAYHSTLENTLYNGTNANQIERALTEALGDEDIHLNVWTGKQGIIDTLKAGYAVLEKVAEAYVSQKGPGYMLDGHLMDAAAIALKYKNVATLEGELGIPQLAQEMARVNSNPALRIDREKLSGYDGELRVLDGVRPVAMAELTSDLDYEI